MNIYQAQSIVRILENHILETARELNLAEQTFQPVVDELSSVRLSYSGINREITADMDENELAAEIIITALALIRSTFILPSAFMESITIETDFQQNDTSVFYETDESEEIDIPNAIFRKEEFNSQRLNSLFDELVSGINRYIREANFAEASFVIRKIEQYFSGEGE